MRSISINTPKRQYCIKSIFDTKQLLDIKHDTCLLAIDILDRVIPFLNDNIPSNFDYITKLTLTCIMIAVKYKETQFDK